VQASRQEARFEASLARANHEFLSQIFGDAMLAGETAAMRARLDRARDFLRRRYEDEPVIHALLLLQLAGRYAELNLNDREADVMKEFTALAEKTKDASLLATRECVDAYDALEDGDAEKARPHVSRGLALMSQARRPLTDTLFECLRADSMLAMNTGDRARAVSRMKELLAGLEQDGLTKTRLYLASLASLAHVYSMGGQYAEGLDISRRKIALDELLGSEQTVGAYAERDNASNLLYVLGLITEAWAEDNRLLEDFHATAEGAMSRRTFSSTSPGTPWRRMSWPARPPGTGSCRRISRSPGLRSPSSGITSTSPTPTCAPADFRTRKHS
jgi:hypothetical protein